MILEGVPIGYWSLEPGNLANLLPVESSGDNFHMASVYSMGQAEAADGNVAASFWCKPDIPHI